MEYKVNYSRDTTVTTADNGSLGNASGIYTLTTVEAIPVEWIEARINRLNRDMRENKRHGYGQIIKMQEWELDGLKDMLDDWREENG